MYGLIHRIERLLSEIEKLLVVQSTKVESIQVRKGKLQFPCDITEINDGFQSYQWGDIWSEPAFDNYCLFRFTVETSAEFQYLSIQSNKLGVRNMMRPQMLIFVDGIPYQGGDTNHTYIKLTEPGTHTVHIYAFSGLPFRTPYGDYFDMDIQDGTRLYIALQQKDPRILDYYYDVKTPFTYLQYFSEQSGEYQEILTALNESLALLDLRQPYSNAFYQSLQQASGTLKERLYSKTYDGHGSATAIGHTHLDIAWLWRYCHTRDKAARSFSTVIALLKQYPEYLFMSSQAQLYDFVKEEFPQLFAEIQSMTADGRWEPEGAMWVEPDMNLTSGEFIVRQILYGKAFFQQEFHVDCKVLWLPDVFGYSAALPQILKKAGIDYFMTAKLASNERNRFPYDTMRWVGIDGSSVLSHLLSYLPSWYTPDIENGELLQGWQNYQQKDIYTDILLPFGHADGGGGPTAEQLETLRRLKNGLPGVPKVKMGTVLDYFKRLDKTVSNNKHLPVWNGEIYYERHRGTYTSMARNKKNNRECEILYQNAEWLWSLYSSFTGAPFPKQDFDKGIKGILINQFHDVLPGSCIKEVYDDTDKIYAEVRTIGETICQEAIQYIASNVKTEEESLVVFNPYSKPVSGYIEHDGQAQYVENVPAKGFGVYPVKQDTSNAVTVQEDSMENQYYKISIGKDGTITSLYDKRAGRECFIPGKSGNVLRIYEDKPEKEDNWNLDSFYTEREYPMPDPSSIEVLETGTCRGILRITRPYMDSVIIQDMVLYAQSPRIDFQTIIDWKEHSQVLKAEFPVDVNTNKATFEIQFGHVERATHRNTSWDEAKFEVCAHKWADISDNGYGMSLLNNCKYGYSADGSTLSLTLLRCGTVPNPDADKELHTFTYSILPHSGSFIEAETVQHAYMLNNPLISVPISPQEGTIGDRYSYAQCDGAVLETIKPAEDGKGTILRLYEPHNRSADVTITLHQSVQSAELCDLLEHPLEPVLVNENVVRYKIKPFEIVTIRVVWR